MREALRRALAHAPDFLRALARLSLDRGGPRDLAAIRDGLAAAAAVGEHCSRRLTIFRPSSSRLTRGCAPTAARSSAILQSTLADDLPLLKRDGGFVRAGAAPALDEARAPARRKPPRHRRAAGVLRRAGGSEAAQDQAQQLSRLLHRNPAGGGRDAAQSPAQRDLHPSPDDGGRDALHHQRARRPRGAHRLGGRPGARSSNSRRSSACAQGCLAEGERLRGFGAALAEIDVAAALAELAVKRNWTRPLVDASLALHDRGRAPSGGRGGAEGGGRAVRRQ